ncbi:MULTISPECIES: helix-turn-helix transcriptional regulator [unclassified Streptomyces]|uniref:helix-turn-helix transcriptional regulator n=1 Tax=unclassified Streptomyces TaxID=2593676 RepID=UPI0022859BA3|nr:helix-turn-helix transcriptional regulator [Streptomyces sp. Je 1-369]WAL96777.1 helix-turn-helix transcriptional regulator [Streptomyces sp. Je 1-369]
MPVEHIPHGVENLCEPGAAVYARALREGGVRGSDADAAPCLIDFGLLHPGPDDMRWLHPTAPAVALPRLLRTIENRVAQHRRHGENLAAVFESFLGPDGVSSPDGETSAISVLQGLPRIEGAIEQAIAGACDEVLVIQPGGVRPPETQARIGDREQEILSRGARLRTLRVHTTRDCLPELAHYEKLAGDIEARTLDEVTESLFVFDRTVAFIPASKDDGIALELRHPALVEYFATTFWRLWRLATPMWPQAAPPPVDSDITARQHAIAGLLVEGLTDAEIADRLGMNIRTARVHIAKLAATLGSNSRAQLGYLIGQSGILDQGR